MVRAGVRFLVIGAVCGLLAVSPTGQAQAAPAARASGSARVSVPAYLGGNSLSALLPGGGRVHYRLPSLPSRGVRLMGDWDGDGAETPGIFVRGRWQLWNQVVRPRAPDVVGSFGQGGDIPVTGDWNGDGVTDVGVVRGSTWFVSLGPGARRRLRDGVASVHVRYAERRARCGGLGRRRCLRSGHGARPPLAPRPLGRRPEPRRPP